MKNLLTTILIYTLGFILMNTYFRNIDKDPLLNQNNENDY